MTVIPANTAQQLLASIEADRLVIMVGAGLSMAAPSSVPSATNLAAYTSVKYTQITSSNVPSGADSNLGIFADFLFASGVLRTLFIDRLVEWEPFFRNPNDGHSALADFLWCRAATFIITTNVDYLVERASEELGSSLRTSLDGVEANRIWTHAAFLKVHGCGVRDPENTVWSVHQLELTPADTLVHRIESSVTWLRANLVGKDLVFIGFWSDWAYLNKTLAAAINGVHSGTVVVVDLSEEAVLRGKAPELWAWATTQERFGVMQASGSEFLDELRGLFCRAFMNRVLASSHASYTALSGVEPTIKELPAAISTQELFSLRRDTCGKPFGKIAVEKRPTDGMKLAGAAHLLLLNNGATLEGGRYKIGGDRVRVVNGSGFLLSQVQATFSQEPLSPDPETYVVCGGGEDDGGVPPSIVGRLRKPTIMRPGSLATWVTTVQAFQINFGAASP